jgi:GcrA cell cycle regulator
VTRNAVIGKVHRLKLSAGPSRHLEYRVSARPSGSPPVCSPAAWQLALERACRSGIDESWARPRNGGGARTSAGPQKHGRRRHLREPTRSKAEVYVAPHAAELFIP